MNYIIMDVNDTFGDDEGDELLCFFSSVLTDVLENHAFVGRMGGDENMYIRYRITVGHREAGLYQ